MRLRTRCLNDTGGRSRPAPVERHQCALWKTLANGPKERQIAALQIRWKVGKSASFQPHIRKGGTRSLAWTPWHRAL